MRKVVVLALLFVACLLIGCSTGPSLPSEMAGITGDLFSSPLVDAVPAGTTVTAERRTRSCESGSPPQVVRDLDVQGSVDDVVGELGRLGESDGWRIETMAASQDAGVLEGRQPVLVLGKTTDHGDMTTAVLFKGSSESPTLVVTSSVERPNRCNG